MFGLIHRKTKLPARIGPAVVAFSCVVRNQSFGTQVTPVWIDFDGEYVLVNSHKGRLKDRNMEERPHVAVEISDPDNPYRYIAIRGRVVEITDEGAEDHIDRLSLRYLNRPYEGAGRGIRRIYKIACDRIETSAWTPPASTAE